VDKSTLGRARRCLARQIESRQRFANEVGDTLVELLVALVIIALTVVAILAAFGTTLSATSEHNRLTTADTVLRSFVETMTYDLQLSPPTPPPPSSFPALPAFNACAGPNAVYNPVKTYQGIVDDFNTNNPIATQNHFAVDISDVEALPVGSTPTCSAPNPGPQQITACAYPKRSAPPTPCGSGSDKLAFVVGAPDASAPVLTGPISISPDSGPAAGGTMVTITGSGFTAPLSVSFGGAPATSVNIVSATQITATSPPGTIPVHVSVTTSAGTSTPTAADLFTYGPTVNGVVASDGPPAGGYSVTVSGTGFASGVQSVQFTSQVGGLVAQCSGTCIVPTSSTTISVTVPQSPIPGSGVGVVDVTVTVGGVPAAVATSPVSEPADEFTYGLSVTSVSPASGSVNGGTPVTISGFGFNGATQVSFASVNVPSSNFTVSPDGTTITLTTPAASAGTVDVQVTTSGVNNVQQTSAKNPPADQFTFTMSSPPVGLGILVTSNNNPTVKCGAISSNYSCAISGVKNGGSVVFYVEFLDANGNQSVFSTTTDSMVTLSGTACATNSPKNGCIASITIPKNTATSSPNTVTASHSGNSTGNASLTLSSGGTTFTLKLTVAS
jgi:type II secretory pathway pseudopilin PulG